MWRYRDYVIRALQCRQAVQLVSDRADRRATKWTTGRPTAISARRSCASVLASTRVKETTRNADSTYLDDMIATIGKGTLGLTLQCARCHNHKFDPILQRDYYAMQASLFGYVSRRRIRWRPRTRSTPTTRKSRRSARSRPPLARGNRKIEAPYRERLRAEAIKRDFLSTFSKRSPSPEVRADGRRELLADQVLKSAVITRSRSIEAMTPEDLARAQSPRG